MSVKNTFLRIRTPLGRLASKTPNLGRGDDTVGNPHRAQISQFELFELILLLKLDNRFPVEQFEATVSQSTVPSPPLIITAHINVYVWTTHPYSCILVHIMYTHMSLSLSLSFSMYIYIYVYIYIYIYICIHIHIVHIYRPPRRHPGRSCCARP